jgi:hypothetical protein
MTVSFKARDVRETNFEMPASLTEVLARKKRLCSE